MEGFTGPTGRTNGADPVIAGSPTDEAGATDNLLTLNPNDPNFKDIVGDWQDNEEYVFEKLRVQQISPGNYRVVSAEGADEATDENDSPAPDPAPDDEEEGGPSENPAVNGLLDSMKE